MFWLEIGLENATLRKRITIRIIEENVVLKKWHFTYGFIHTGTKNIPSLPFTVGFMEMTL